MPADLAGYDIYRRTRPQAREALDKALDAAPNETARKRVELLATAYRLAELAMDAYEVKQRIESARKPARADVFAYKKVADEWHALVFDREEKDCLDYSYLVVALYGKEYVNRDLADFYAARYIRGRKTRITCARVAKPPVIDGTSATTTA